jgi:excisionase family DNA binding protein
MQTIAATQPTLRDYLTVSQAATLLGVSASTLRNWDRMGKVAAHRHPVNGYRLYVRSDLEKFLRAAARPQTDRAPRWQRRR